MYCVTDWNKAQRDNQHRYQRWSAALESSIRGTYGCNTEAAGSNCLTPVKQVCVRIIYLKSQNIEHERG